LNSVKGKGRFGRGTVRKGTVRRHGTVLCLLLLRKGDTEPSPVSTLSPVRTTGLAGGLLHPYKGLVPACARKAH
jgi:hypothetical protein